MSKRGMILIVSGPSGAGKGTVLKRAMELNPEMRYSTSVTTRKPRQGEIPDVSYYFTDNDTFDEMIASGEIMEWDEFAGNRYGTPKTPLKNAVESGEDIVMDITVKGALAVKEAFPEDAVTVFILPPSEEELERRLRGRKTESEAAIRRRLRIAKRELKMSNIFQYSVLNDNVDRAAAEILSIMDEHRKGGQNAQDTDIITNCEHCE